MYSGHLAQMAVLTHWVTGNASLATQGWDFAWNGTAFAHYNTSRLLGAVAAQMTAYPGAPGGVPCEPDSVFVICNDFPHNAFGPAGVLYPGVGAALGLGNLTALWAGECGCCSSKCKCT